MLLLARTRLLQVAVLMGVVLGVGTAGYMAVEGWGVFDSFWMTVITVATIGYGEVHPLTHNGRLFTLVLIFLGLGTTAYAFSQLTAFIVEGDLSTALRRNKMEKRIRELEQHFIVCGLGHTGQVVLDELTKTQRPLVIVEKDAEKASDLEAKGFSVIHGDASHDDVLEKAGIQKARGIFCVLGHDQENLLLTLAARGLNASVRIVTELHDGRFRERLTRCGADAVVDSPHIGGLRLASEMVRPITVGFLDSMIRDRSYTYRFEEVLLSGSSRLAGRAVSQLAGTGGRLPAVVAVKEKASGRYAINPDPGHTLAEGDVLVVLGSTDEIARLKAAV
jgi:voltage-gated potassium channel